MEVDGVWWSLMANDGGLCRLMEFDGVWWSLMAVDGGLWRLMEFDGIWWRLMEAYGGWWRLIEVDGGWWRLIKFEEGWWRLIKSKFFGFNIFGVNFFAVNFFDQHLKFRKNILEPVGQKNLTKVFFWEQLFFWNQNCFQAFLEANASLVVGMSVHQSVCLIDCLSVTF